MISSGALTWDSSILSCTRSEINSSTLWRRTLRTSLKASLRKPIFNRCFGVVTNMLNRRHFGVIIMRAAYGFDDVERNRDIIQTTVTLLAEMGEARKPGRYLVNVFPILKYVPGWFPGAGFQQHFKYLAAKSMQVLHRPFEEAKVLLVCLWEISCCKVLITGFE
jgi:hypothetical protein